jgi:tetratricopeptide (TPR) repeat protein
MNTLAESYREEAKQYIKPPGGVIDYLPYFRKSRYKNAAKLFEKAAAEYTACDATAFAAECYFASGYNFMLADVLDKAVQCYILAAKMYKQSDYSKSVTAYLHVVDIYEKQRRPEMCIKYCDMVAGIYNKEGKCKEAIRFYEQCIQIAGKEGYSPVNFQEKIAVIQTTHFEYYATAITTYDSIIQNSMGEPIVHPFMMIAIMLRILVNEEVDSIDKYIDKCLGVNGFMNTDYYMFIKEMMMILDSNEGDMNECYTFYREREKGFSNVVVEFLVSKIIKSL